MRRIGTRIICAIALLGTCIVVTSIACFGMRYCGWPGNKFSQVLLQNASVDVGFLSHFSRKYPKQQSKLQKYEETVDNVETFVQNFCTTSFPRNADITRLIRNYKSGLLASNLDKIEVKQTKDPAFDNAVNAVESLYNHTTSLGIDFALLQVQEEETTEGERFIDALNRREIPAYEIAATDSDGYLMDATEHWWTKEALSATRDLATILNEDYSYEFSLDLFDEDTYVDALVEDETARQRILQAEGDDYKILMPSNDFYYEVLRNEDVVVKGDFRKTMIAPLETWDHNYKDNGTNGPYHDVIYIDNGTIFDATNKDAATNADKKILVLGDSFAWPVVPYLAQGVGEIIFMNPGYFNGSIQTYITMNKPDMVVVFLDELEVSNSVYVRTIYPPLGQ